MRLHVVGAAFCAAIGALPALQATAGDAAGLDCDFELITLVDGQAIQMPTQCCDPATLACTGFGAAPAAPSLDLPGALDAMVTLPARIVDLIPTLVPERQSDPQQWPKQP